MKILLQTNNRKEQQLILEYNKLTESGFEVVPFGYYRSKDDKSITFTGLEDLDPDSPFILRANIGILKALKLDNVSSNIDLSKTIDYNPEAFKFTHMPSHEVFLNLTPNEHAFIPLRVVLKRILTCDVFFKPNNDLKLFGGTFVPKGKSLLEVLEAKGDRTTFTDEQLQEQILCSKFCPRIIEEVRCYVVNKKVVTISRYRYKDEYNTTPLPQVLEEQYIMFAQRVIDKWYYPGDNFTIDLCEIGDNTLRVIEYNCLTSSGLYNCDTKKLFNALKEYYYPTCPT